MPPLPRRPVTVIAAAVAALAMPAAAAAQPAPASVSAPVSYADVADLAVESANIIDARIRRASAVPAASAPAGMPAHLVRMYVEAEVNTVIFGRDAVARRVGYLVDLPRRSDGRAPRVNGERVLIFARPITTANRLALIHPSAQMAWNAGRDATVRSIAAEMGRGAPPPAITGVARAFHVPGTIAGEGETQIFLRTATDDPASLTVLRRPGMQRQWAVAFGEIVDESATIPDTRTLGWYRLACGLPDRLPPASIARLTSAESAITAEDYAFVLRQIAPCDRTPPRGG